MSVRGSNNAFHGIIQPAVRTVEALLLKLIVKFPDLFLYFFVFSDLPPEKVQGNSGLLLHTLRGKKIHILDLSPRFFKTIDLEKSFLGQFRKAIIDLTQADAHTPGHLTLGEV